MNEKVTLLMIDLLQKLSTDSVGKFILRFEEPSEWLNQSVQAKEFRTSDFSVIKISMKLHE